MAKLNILADAHIPYLQGVAEQFGEVEYLPGNQFTEGSIKDKDVLIVRTVTHFGEEILNGSSVKLICSATIGYDHIDTAYCDARQIAWRAAPGCNADSVEQYLTASLLYLARKYRIDLKDKTIGIVGVGNVGSRVDKACRKLGMRTLLNDPPRAEKEGKGAFVDLDRVLREADIITLHTPLTKSGLYKTHHLADGAFFDGLGKKPILINACRGGVVDNEAWARAIKAGKILGSVIDCWEGEPHIHPELLRLVDIATPHVAGYSADGKWTATKMSLENINEFFGIGIAPIELLPIHKPDNPLIDLKGISAGEQLAAAVRATYNPEKETIVLKENPDKFYYFRSNYPLRREYKAYRVKNADPSVAEILRKLGFGEIEN
ncbi:MAG: 4-phosphoerythronate dehydrogenase PdxB [Dysgonamonadaceae bacterium]|jgi:erythronate-4-phosphate dehydrogenase|nr:4-phosphoerythronate dehydrogenase PdxB [Dysgonamonadaceae bacterium]